MSSHKTLLQAGDDTYIIVYCHPSGLTASQPALATQLSQCSCIIEAGSLNSLLQLVAILCRPGSVEK